MKRIISFISIFVLFVNLFAFPVPVKADGLPIPGYTELKEMQQDIQNGDNRTVQDIWNILQPIGQAVGIVMNPIQTIEFIRDVVDPVAQTLPNYPTNGSDTDKANYLTEYMVNNTTTNDNNKTYTLNQNAKTLVNGVVNNYINKTPYTYVYGCDLDASRSYFGNNFNDCKKILQDNPSHLELIKGYYPNSNVYVQDINISRQPTYAVHKQTYNADWEYIDLYTASLSGNEVIVQPFTAYDNNDLVVYDALPDTLNEITNIQYPFSPEGQWWGYMNTSPGKSCDGDQWYYYPKYFTANNNGIMEFNLLSDLENYVRNYGNGKYFYYKNNTVYNNYKNSGNNSYTVTNDNSNKVTYRDINTYIDNSVRDTGDYPTLPDIEIWIESNPVSPTPTPTPTTTPDNPSGGGTASASATANNSGVNVTVNNNHNINFNVPGLSGNGIGSGTVSGNGNGSGGIFDWISDIGSVIGDFIKNVGELIADVVKGITETITTILADIPNIISVLVEFVYGGLPDELKAIVTLGITTVIFVGVIKMMRK